MTDEREINSDADFERIWNEACALRGSGQKTMEVPVAVIDDMGFRVMSPGFKNGWVPFALVEECVDSVASTGGAEAHAAAWNVYGWVSKRAEERRWGGSNKETLDALEKANEAISGMRFAIEDVTEELRKAKARIADLEAR